MSRPAHPRLTAGGDACFAEDESAPEPAQAIALRTRIERAAG